MVEIVVTDEFRRWDEDEISPAAQKAVSDVVERLGMAGTLLRSHIRRRSEGPRSHCGNFGQTRAG